MAQEPHFAHYTTEDGLPSNEVYETLQDDEGFLWIATDEGVARFDGYEFRSFTTRDGLPENTVLDLFKDDKGRVWFVTMSKGICYYQDGIIHPYKYNEVLNKNQDQNDVVFAFYVNSSDEVFIACSRPGILKIDANGEPNRLPFPQAYQDSIFFYLHSVEEGFLIELTLFDPTLPGGVNARRCRSLKITTDHEQAHIDLETSTPQFIPSYRGLFSYQQTKDHHYVNLGHILLKFSPSSLKKGTAETRNFDGGLYSFLKTEDRLLLCQSKGGVEVYLDSFAERDPEAKWLQGETITNIYKDDAGGLWFSSLASGLFYLEDPSIQSYPKTGFLSGSHIVDMEKVSNGKLAIAYEEVTTNDMLRNGNEVTHWSLRMYDKALGFDKFGDTLIVQTQLKSALNNMEVSVALNTRPYKLDSDFILEATARPFIKSLRNTSEKIYLKRTNYEVIVSKGSNYKVIPLPGTTLRVNAAVVDSLDNVWIGATGALWIYKDGHLGLFDTTDILLNSTINDFEISGTNLFMASKENGLIIKTKDRALNIAEKDGLLSDNVNSIELCDHAIWCGTSKGLSRVEIISTDPLKFSIQNFHEENGLISNLITKLVAIDSILYIGTEKGLSRIITNKLKTAPTPPTVRIEAVLIGDSSTSANEIQELNYDQSNITFEFTGLSFRDHGKVKYRYRLLGLNDEWKETQQRSADYEFIPPGNYTFEVAAAGKNGQWSTEARSLSFVVLPPIWLEWWFIVLEILVGLVIISFILIWVIRNQRKRALVELRIIRSEQMALQAQMNPHFMFNALNSIQSFIAQSEKKKAIHYLRNFSGLIRNALYNSTYSLISLEQEIRSLQLYIELENLRMDQSINFHMAIDKDIDLEELKIPPMILQPLIENAIWHGLSPKKEDRKLKLEFKWLEHQNSLLCAVEDNGIGRKMSLHSKGDDQNLHKSMGLKNIEERLALLNNYYSSVFTLKVEDLEDKGSQPCGTRIELLIRMTKNYH